MLLTVEVLTNLIADVSEVRGLGFDMNVKRYYYQDYMGKLIGINLGIILKCYLQFFYCVLSIPYSGFEDTSFRARAGSDFVRVPKKRARIHLKYTYLHDDNSY